MQIYMHQTHHTIGDFDGIFSYVSEIIEKINNKSFEKGLHLFPENFLTGYPLQDLCVQRSFIDSYLQLLEKLQLLQINNESALLLGGLKYTFDNRDLPLEIENVILELSQHGLKDIYSKKLLPNYDIFDEKKYFKAGDRSSIYKYQGKTLGLLICEDMWFSTHHQENPVDDLEKDLKGQQLDAIINLSASPFYLSKEQSRFNRASTISKHFGCPFLYINKVGAEDEILFDGGSFIVNGDKLEVIAKSFEKDLIQFDLRNLEACSKEKNETNGVSNSWESLFDPNIDNSVPKLKDLSDQECETILHALKLGIQDYAKKCGMKNFLVALSGGIDSALVLAILKLIKTKEQSVEAIYMPGFYSASLSYDLSKKMCDTIGIKLTNLPIKFLHSNVRNIYEQTFGNEMTGLCDENIQSRLRGSLLYSRSNDTGAMVLNTSNKSEIAIGYSTLYGDSVGALSILGDLYKTEVFALAKYINKKYGEIIPEKIITRPPSAELRENQEDSQSLPPYERLDVILEGLLSYRLNVDNLVKMGLERGEVEKTYRLYNISEYKRKQFCPIIKLKSKSFGFGYRLPICKKF